MLTHRQIDKKMRKQKYRSDRDAKHDRRKLKSKGRGVSSRVIIHSNEMEVVQDIPSIYDNSAHSSSTSSSSRTTQKKQKKQRVKKPKTTAAVPQPLTAEEYRNRQVAAAGVRDETASKKRQRSDNATDKQMDTKKQKKSLALSNREFVPSVSKDQQSNDYEYLLELKKSNPELLKKIRKERKKAKKMAKLKKQKDAKK